MTRQKILLVDDSESIRSAIRGFLDGAGYAVREADSVQTALEATAKERFDAGVVDYLLPDGTSLDLMPRLREQGVSLPLVVLTAHGSIDLAVRAMKEGAEHFLTKPVELPALAVVVERVAEDQRGRRRDAAARASRKGGEIDPFMG